jgi:hypothetical protein
MAGDHPDPQLLERFMRNEADARERRAIVRHLLAGCPRCTAVTGRLWRFGEPEPDAAADDGALDSAACAPAEADLQEARRELLRAGRGTEAARALLDLALLYTRQGRSEEVQQLAADLYPILRVRGVSLNVVIALLLFRRLVETGHATPEVLSQVARFLADPPETPRPALW